MTQFMASFSSWLCKKSIGGLTTATNGGVNVKVRARYVVDGAQHIIAAGDVWDNEKAFSFSHHVIRYLVGNEGGDLRLEIFSRSLRR